MERSLGFIEISGVTAAIDALDIMCKTADVELVSWERKLGGRLVTLIVRGNVSAVTEAVEAAFAVNRDSFPRNNAVAAVLFAALDDGSGGDIDTMKLLLEGMQELKTQAADFPDEDLDYLNALIKLTAERMEKLS